MRNGLIVLMCVAIVFASSCTTSQQQTTDQAVIAIEKNLSQLVSSLTKLGLTQWSKKDAPAAKEGAKIISKNVRTVALPYFKDGELPLSQAAQNILAEVGKGLPKEATAVIVVVMATIQAAITVPEATDYMTERQRDDVIIGLTALSDACDKFLK